MEKLNVTVGFIFTQVMFCDDHGKLHLHRVMTDVDKPWESVEEVLGLVKEGLSLDKPNFIHRLMTTIQIHLEYKMVHFQSYLMTLHDKLSAAFSNCLILIKDLQEEAAQPAIEQQEEQWVSLKSPPADSMEEGQVVFIENKQAQYVGFSNTLMEFKKDVNSLGGDVFCFEFDHEQNTSTIWGGYPRGSPELIC